jgi:hypothetical protein
MDWEYKTMFSKRARFIIPAIILMLAYQTSCKGPFTYETHPVIWVSSYQLTFSASEAGSNPSPQVIQIKNSGVETLIYTIADDVDWLTISPNSGTSSGQVLDHAISVDKSGLASRSDAYTAKITIMSTQACNSPQQVSVSLNLSKEPPPEISVTPKDVRFIATVGGSNPPAQTIRVRNSGQGTLSYTLSEDSSWLNVNPASGTSTGSENAHTLTVNTGGLATGTYTATVNVVDANAVNNPQAVNVTLEIGTSLPPTIAVSPGILRFSARVGGSNPGSQNIRVRNSGQGTLNYAVSSDSAWLNVSPASGTSTGREVSHRVSVNIAGLTTGNYTGRITISSPNATNSPQTVAVTLDLGQTPTNNRIGISSSRGDILITILGNTQQIKAFGLDLTYDKNALSVVGIKRGSLTGSWAQLSFSQTSSGVRIGGFAGDPSQAIPVGSSGTIVIVQLTGQGQVCMTNLTDDISGMIVSPGCTTR